MSEKPTYEELERRIAHLRRLSGGQKTALQLRSDLRNRMLIANAADAIWSAEINTLRLTSVNPALEQLLGRPAKELLYRRLMYLFSKESYGVLIGVVRDLLAALRAAKTSPVGTVDLELRQSNSNGVLILATRLGLAADDKGRPTELIGVSRVADQRPSPPQEAEPRPFSAGGKASFRFAFDSIATACAIVEDDTTISLVNSEFEKLAKLPRNKIEDKLSLTRFISDKEKSRVIEYHVLRRQDRPLVPRTYETEWIDHLGEIKPVYIAESLVPGTKQCVTSIFDLTKIREAEEAFLKQRAYFHQLFEGSPQAIMILDTKGTVIDVNKGFESLFGYEARKIRGKYAQNVAIPQERIEEHDTFCQWVISGKSLQRETYRSKRDGSVIPVFLLGYPIRVNQRVEGIFYIYQDISQQKAFEAELHHKAFYDSLTGIPNRALFMERLGRALERSRRRPDYSFAVLLADLDRFKGINDSLGHLFGDQLLIDVSKRLQSCIRTVDTVARLGGDEFSILCEEFGDSQEVIEIADRIQQASKQPFRIKGHQVHITASVGIVLDTRYYSNAEDILRDADIAMYRAKEQGKACFMVFDKKMHDDAVASLQKEIDLRNALIDNELQLYYQPILDVASGKIEGLEALLRWVHPRAGLINPESFIPLAEETGLIIEIGDWVINEACRQMKTWQRRNPEFKAISIAINISSLQFQSDDIVDTIMGALQHYELNPSCLKLELTESMVMENAGAAVTKLKKMKELGIKLAIDDFGTGYSSLAYLNMFPIDNLKIDRSFINGLEYNEENVEIVRAIISLGKSLGHVVIAEGVEQQGQLQRLRELSCDHYQGYLFSRPLSRDEIFKLISAGSDQPQASESRA